MLTPARTTAHSRSSRTAAVSTTRTWGQLAEGARAVAAALSDSRPATISRARCCSCRRTQRFSTRCSAAFSPVRARCPAHVPIPSRLAQTLPRLRAIVAEAQPQVVLTTSELLPARALVPELAEIPCIAVDELGGGDAPALDVTASIDDLAILQYSSGSTGAPRGVMVSHQNLIANEALIQNAFEHTSSTVFLGWLPFQHDMGLIGMLMQPVFIGARVRDDDAAAVPQASAALAAGDHPVRRYHQWCAELRVRDVRRGRAASGRRQPCRA